MLMFGTALAAMLAAGGLVAPGAAIAQTSTDEAETRLDTVNQAISRIESWLTETRRERSAQEAELSTLKDDIDRISRSISDLETEIERLTAAVAVLDDDRGTLLSDSRAQSEQLAVMLRASYQAGADTPLKLLLNQEDMTRTRRMMVYLAAFNRERLEQIAQLQLTLQALDDNALLLATTRAAQQTQLLTLAEQRADLQAREGERQALIAELDASITGRANELAQLQQDRANLQALIEEISRIMIDIPDLEELMPFVDSRGRMPWPLAGEIAARFGDRYGGGNLQRQGIIVTAPAGTAVRAVHSGRVVFSDWLRGSGNLIIVDHGNGYVSLYAHQQSLNKRSGDWVNRGEALGLAGSDAGSGVPGVYFEIRRNSQALNPVDWLEAVR